MRPLPTLIVAAVLWAGVARADEPVALRFADLQSLLRKHSPALKADRAGVDVQRAAVQASRIQPNPNLSYSALSLAVGGNTTNGTQHTLGIAQPWLLAGRLQARVDAATAEVLAAEARVEWTAAELLREARLRWVDLQVAETRVEVLTAAHAELKALQRIVELRAGAGTRSPFDVERIGTELDALASRVEVEKAAHSGAVSLLGEVLGMETAHIEAEGPLAPLGLTAAATATELGPTPVVIAWQRAEVAAQAGRALAEREKWPVPVVSAGMVLTTDPGSAGIFAGLGIDLPTFDRGQGRLAIAQAQMGAVRSQLAAATWQQQAARQRAQRILAGAQQSLATYERTVAARLDRLRQMAEDQYRFGRSDLLDLLDAQRSRLDLRLERANLVETVQRAEVEWLFSLGQ